MPIYTRITSSLYYFVLLNNSLLTALIEMLVRVSISPV